MASVLVLAFSIAVVSLITASAHIMPRPHSSFPRPSSGNCPRQPEPMVVVDPSILSKKSPAVVTDKLIDIRVKRSSMTKKDPVVDQLGDITVADDVDLCFLVDVTGSMSPFIRAVKESIFEIVDRLQNATDADAVRDMRIAFVGYRDHSDGQNRFEVLDFTGNATKFHDFVAKTRATGGGDLPEDIHGGIYRALGLEWGDESRTRLIFHMADAPAHGCDMHLMPSDSYPQGDPEKRTFEQLFTKLRDMDIQYTFGNITALTDTMLERMSEAYGSQVNVIDLGINSRIGGGFGRYDSAMLKREVSSAVYSSVRDAVYAKKTGTK